MLEWLSTAAVLLPCCLLVSPLRVAPAAETAVATPAADTAKGRPGVADSVLPQGLTNVETTCLALQALEVLRRKGER